MARCCRRLLLLLYFPPQCLVNACIPVFTSCRGTCVSCKLGRFASRQRTSSALSLFLAAAATRVSSSVDGSSLADGVSASGGRS
ncbi:hypothetical protein IWX50DRAFT_87277 [Phyllosticta citricarpa]